MVIAGTAEHVDAMIDWLQKGSPRAVVSAVHIEEILPTERLPSFEIRY